MAQKDHTIVMVARENQPSKHQIALIFSIGVVRMVKDYIAPQKTVLRVTTDPLTPIATLSTRAPLVSYY